MTPLESYIHLDKDPFSRRKTLLNLREEKLEMTLNYIEQKARDMDINKPHFFVDSFEKFGTHYTVDFMIRQFEGVTLQDVACTLYQHTIGNDGGLAEALGYLSIREAFDSMQCTFLHQRIVSQIAAPDHVRKGQGSSPLMEANEVFYIKVTDDCAVLASDYIDRDDLHPYRTKDHVRKDISSG